ncbi:MAG: hypothetical protein D6756_02715, partial [Cyanobacteria bacterium J083]
PRDSASSEPRGQPLLRLITKSSTADYFQEEKYFSLTLDVQKKMPNFGFGNLIADWNFFLYVQYFGDGKARDVTGYTLISEYFDVIVNNDPRFIKAYLALSTTNSLYGGYPDKTVANLDRVLQAINPKMSNYPFQIWVFKGVDEILFLGDMKGAKNSYEMAADWAEQSIEPEGKLMVKRYKKTAAFLASNPDNTRAQVGAWLTIFYNTNDKMTKRNVINRIQALGVKVTLNPAGRLQIKFPEN